MKKLLSKISLYSLAMAMAQMGQSIYNTGRDTPSREVKQQEKAKKYSSPSWSFGHIIYARNEREAIKRAGKRGIWRERMEYHKC